MQLIDFDHMNGGPLTVPVTKWWPQRIAARAN